MGSHTLSFALRLSMELPLVRYGLLPLLGLLLLLMLVRGILARRRRRARAAVPQPQAAPLSPPETPSPVCESDGVTARAQGRPFVDDARRFAELPPVTQGSALTLHPTACEEHDGKLLITLSLTVDAQAELR